MEILLDSVFLAFGQHEVLRGAHLRLRKGRVTGMLGRNGTGKSCMLKVLTGQIRPENYYVGVDGVFQKNLYATPGLINYLPQHSCHPEQLRLTELLRYYGVSEQSFMTTHGHVLPPENPRFGALSGGTKRLFEVLLLLAADTHFTLLDEPFTHLMPVHVAYVQQVIRARAQVKGVLVTDHQFEQVLELADVLYLLHSGTSTVVDGREDLVRLGYLR